MTAFRCSSLLDYVYLKDVKFKNLDFLAKTVAELESIQMNGFESPAVESMQIEASLSKDFDAVSFLKDNFPNFGM
jgi:hypothetical protein